MFTGATIKHEMDKCERLKREAMDRNDRRISEFYYGAECALSWALNNPNDPTMKPSKMAEASSAKAEE